jgi:hypothetical protein
MAQANSQSKTPGVFLDSRETPLAADAVILSKAIPAPAAEVVLGAEESDPIFAAIYQSAPARVGQEEPNNRGDLRR